MEFVALDDGVYDVVHIPADNVHVVELNNPPALPSLHDRVPLGIVGEFAVSATVAVSVIALPGTKDSELEVIVTDVESIAEFIAIEYVPELV